MDHDTQLSSGSLFHYTPTLDNLKGILRSGFRPSYALERSTFSFVDDPTPEEAKLVSQANIHKWVHLRKTNPPGLDLYVAMVSFCDIPIPLSRTHAKVYGRYAVGLSKRWAEDVVGLNPLLYMASQSQLLRSFNHLWTRLSLLDQTYFFHPPPDHFSIGSPEEIASDHANDSLYQFRGYQRILNICREIACHVKLYEGPFAHGHYTNDHHRFYDEREWRYLPSDNGRPSVWDCRAPKEIRDHFIAGLAPLPIHFGSITHLLVQSEAEKEDLRTFLKGLQVTGETAGDGSNIKIVRLEEVCQQDAPSTAAIEPVGERAPGKMKSPG